VTNWNKLEGNLRPEVIKAFSWKMVVLCDVTM